MHCSAAAALAADELDLEIFTSSACVYVYVDTWVVGMSACVAVVLLQFTQRFLMILLPRVFHSSSFFFHFLNLNTARDLQQLRRHLLSCSDDADSVVDDDDKERVQLVVVVTDLCTSSAQDREEAWQRCQTFLKNEIRVKKGFLRFAGFFRTKSAKPGAFDSSLLFFSADYFSCLLRINNCVRKQRQKIKRTPCPQVDCRIWALKCDCCQLKWSCKSWPLLALPSSCLLETSERFVTNKLQEIS